VDTVTNQDDIPWVPDGNRCRSVNFMIVTLPKVKCTRSTVFLSALLVAAGLILALFGQQDRAAAGLPHRRCSEAMGTTVQQAQGIRLYKVAGNPRTKVFVCATPNGSPHLFGPHREAGSWSASMPGPFAIGYPWVGGIEQHQIGQDTLELVARGWRLDPSNRTPDCLVGGADRPGQLPQIKKFFVTSHGTIIWAATRESQSTNQLAICSGTKSRTLAQGGGLEIKSVQLERGHVLEWADEAGAHSTTIP
jgi:hypothetical protein